jgi:hypothetical protein
MLSQLKTDLSTVLTDLANLEASRDRLYQLGAGDVAGCQHSDSTGGIRFPTASQFRWWYLTASNWSAHVRRDESL